MTMLVVTRIGGGPILALAGCGLSNKTVFLTDDTRCLDHSLSESASLLEVDVYQPERNLGFARGCARGISLAMKQAPTSSSG
jgi:GT2 family glycosyltransferase